MMRTFNIILISALILVTISGAYGAKYKNFDPSLFKFDTIDRKNIKIIAEGGNALYAPENTVTSFKQAVDMGTDLMLIDVRITADKQAVAIKDFTIDRTTSGYGEVSQLTLDELKSYSAGYESVFEDTYEYETVPSLVEVFTVLKNKPCIINVFNVFDIPFIRNSANKANYSESNMILLLDNVTDITVIKNNAKKIKFFLSDPLSEYFNTEEKLKWVENAKKGGVDGFLISYDEFFDLPKQEQGSLAILMAKNNIGLYLYGLRSNVDMDKAMSFQIKGKVKNKAYTCKLAGIITDDPAKALMVAGKLKIK